MTTISPAEFGVLVDLALNSNAPVGRVLQFGDLFQRAAKLANSKGSIGEIVPPASKPASPTDLEALRAAYEKDPFVPPRNPRDVTYCEGP